MTDALVRKALELWSLPVDSFFLAAHRENIVYRLMLSGGDSMALRLHRRGYHDASALKSEMLWLAALTERGIKVPTPILSRNGRYFESVDDVHVDILTWLPGKPMGSAITNLDFSGRTGTMFRLGAALARLHIASDGWPLPETFKRHSWDCEGLVGEQPFWGRFWDNHLLSEEEKVVLSGARDTARTLLTERLSQFDYGLIHADPVRENVLIDGNDISLIDFDDGGFGFRLFDLATVLVKCRMEPDSQSLRDQLISGYRSIREIDVTCLDLFLALRAFTYLGWIAPRMSEPWAPQRLARFKQDAMHYAAVLERSVK